MRPGCHLRLELFQVLAGWLQMHMVQTIAMVMSLIALVLLHGQDLNLSVTDAGLSDHTMGKLTNLLGSSS